MIKPFKIQDVLVTDFTLQHQHDALTINDGFEKTSIDTSSFIQHGEKYDGHTILYEQNIKSSESHRNVLHNKIKQMYYNTYNNAYNMFGVYGYDTSKIIFKLDNTFLLVNFNIYQMGDGIQPKTIKLHNTTGDIIANIYDDGYHNLYLSGTYFINKYIKSSDAYNIKIYGEYGLGKYYKNKVDEECEFDRCLKEYTLTIKPKDIHVCAGTDKQTFYNNFKNNVPIENKILVSGLIGNDSGEFGLCNTVNDIMYITYNGNPFDLNGSFKLGEIYTMSVCKFIPSELCPDNTFNCVNDTKCNDNSYNINYVNGYIHVIPCKTLYVYPNIIPETMVYCSEDSPYTPGNLDDFKEWVKTNINATVDGLFETDTGSFTDGIEVEYDSGWNDGSYDTYVTVKPTTFIPSENNINKYTNIIYYTKQIKLSRCRETKPLDITVKTPDGGLEICQNSTYNEYVEFINNLIPIDGNELGENKLLGGDTITYNNSITGTGWSSDLEVGDTFIVHPPTEYELSPLNTYMYNVNINPITVTVIDCTESVILTVIMDDIDVCQHDDSPTHEELIEYVNIYGLQGNDTADVTFDITPELNTSVNTGSVFTCSLNININSENDDYVYNIHKSDGYIHIVSCLYTASINVNVNPFCPSVGPNFSVSTNYTPKKPNNLNIITSSLPYVHPEPYWSNKEPYPAWEYNKTYNVNPGSYEASKENINDHNVYIIQSSSNDVRTKQAIECNDYRITASIDVTSTTDRFCPEIPPSGSLGFHTTYEFTPYHAITSNITTLEDPYVMGGPNWEYNTLYDVYPGRYAFEKDGYYYSNSQIFYTNGKVRTKTEEECTDGGDPGPGENGNGEEPTIETINVSITITANSYVICPEDMDGFAPECDINIFPEKVNGEFLIPTCDGCNIIILDKNNEEVDNVDYGNVYTLKIKNENIQCAINPIDGYDFNVSIIIENGTLTTKPYNECNPPPPSDGGYLIIPTLDESDYDPDQGPFSIINLPENGVYGNYKPVSEDNFWSIKLRQENIDDSDDTQTFNYICENNKNKNSIFNRLAVLTDSKIPCNLEKHYSGSCTENDNCVGIKLNYLNATGSFGFAFKQVETHTIENDCIEDSLSEYIIYVYTEVKPNEDTSGLDILSISDNLTLVKRNECNMEWKLNGQLLVGYIGNVFTSFNDYDFISYPNITENNKENLNDPAYNLITNDSVENSITYYCELIKRELDDFGNSIYSPCLAHDYEKNEYRRLLFKKTYTIKAIKKEYTSCELLADDYTTGINNTILFVDGKINPDPFGSHNGCPSGSFSSFKYNNWFTFNYNDTTKKYMFDNLTLDNIFWSSDISAGWYWETFNYNTESSCYNEYTFNVKHLNDDTQSLVFTSTPNISTGENVWSSGSWCNLLIPQHILYDGAFCSDTTSGDD